MRPKGQIALDKIVIIEKFVPKKTTLPPLLKIHFQLTGNALTLTASDAATLSSATISLNDTPFDFDPIIVLVDADKLIKFILSLNADTVSIYPELENNKIVLRSKGRRTTLNTMSVSEYIEISFDEPEKKVSIDPALFSSAIKSVAGYHLPSNDPQLSIYRGIELLIDANGLRVSATDTFVGAIYQHGTIASVLSNKLLVMGEQLADVAKVLSDCDELNLGIPGKEDTKLFIHGYIGSVKVKILVQLLANQDKYSDIYAGFTGMLGGTLTTVLLDKTEVLDALKPVDAYEDIFVTITIKSDEIQIAAEDEHIGEYVARIQCDVTDFVDEVLFRINKKYLSRALKNLGDFAYLKTNSEIPLAIMLPDYNPDEDEYVYYQGIGKIIV